MRLSPDAWLAGVLGLDVFRLDDAGGLTNEQTVQLDAHIARQSRAMYYAKLDTCAVRAVAALSQSGFAVVDVNVTFAAPPVAIDGDRSTASGVDVAVADAGDRAATLDIAGSCFRYSRFHLDPRVPADAAHRVKREWVAGYFDGRRGDCLFVARAAGRVAGFLAALVTEHEGAMAAVIDLVGVAAAAQRAGVGRALVRSFAAHYAAHHQLLVGTQAANIPSIRMYEGLGFRAIRSAYVLHRHVGTEVT